MRSIFGIAGQALVAMAIIVASAQPATASNKPIPGIDIIVRKEPGGTAIVRTRTDARGNFSARLKPGTYTVEIPGPSLRQALDRVNPGPAKTLIELLVVIAARNIRVASTSTSFSRTGPVVPLTFRIYVAAGDVNGDGVEYTGSVFVNQGNPR